MPLCGRNRLHAAGNTLQAATRVGPVTVTDLPAKDQLKVQSEKLKRAEPRNYFVFPYPIFAAFCVLRSAFCVLRSAFCVLRSA
ncbi:hypothetical protein, partial [Alcanivorax sp.]|uniref:hypothetical protein n=1 Tax=Alcanivorax sp. TaxID=1872427 RepID=UPI0025C13430